MAHATPTVAIIGMGGRWPGADSPEALFDALLTGRNLVQRVSPRDLLARGRRHGPAPRADGRCAVGLVDGPIAPDPRRLGAAPGAWDGLGPREQLLVTATLDAFEDAGLSLDKFLRHDVSVTIAAMGGGDPDLQAGVNQAASGGDRVSAMLRGGGFLLANRLSHLFGFQAPSHSLDAAHASALVALHEARTSLERGDCDIALVGAVAHDFAFWQGAPELLSPDGHCAVFDAQANGVAPSEGVGVLLLMTEERVLEWDLRPRAFILSSAVRHSGDAAALGRPNQNAQTEVIRAALREVLPLRLQLSAVELHGTGTRVGDPIEVASLAQVVGQTADKRSEPCVIGSLKALMGHAEAASGMAGLQKAVRMLETGLAPAHPPLSAVNPLIDLEPGGVLHLPSRVTPLRSLSPDEPIRIGVTALGIGGSCAHVILQAPSAPPASSGHVEAEVKKTKGGGQDGAIPAARPGRALPLFLSATDPGSLQRLSEAWCQSDGVAGTAPFEQALCSQAIGRASLVARRVVWAKSWSDLRAQLRQDPAPALTPKIRSLRAIGAPALNGPADVAAWLEIPVFRDAVNHLAVGLSRAEIAQFTGAKGGARPWPKAKRDLYRSVAEAVMLFGCQQLGLGRAAPLQATSLVGAQAIARVTDMLPAPILESSRLSRPDQAVQTRGGVMGPIDPAAFLAHLIDTAPQAERALNRLWHAGLPGLDPKLVPDTDPQAVRVARKLRVLAPLVDAAGLELPLSRDCPWGTVVRYWSKLASDDALLALLAGQSVPGDAKADFDAWVAGLPGGALGPDPTSLEDFVLDVKAEDENEAGAQDGVVAPSEWTDPLAALADLWQSGADLYLPRLWPLPLTPRVSIPRHPDPLPEPGADRLEASILASASAPASGASDAAGDQPLRDWLKNLIAVVVQRPAASLPEEAGLAEACGVDSLANEAILAKLSRSVGDVPATLLFSCPTIAALAAWLTRERSEAVAALDLAVEARGAPLKASTTEVPTTERPRHRSPPQPGREPVAVVGLAGRFPGAPDIHSFWQMLKDGVSAISEVPPERWDWQAWAGEKGQGDGGHYTRFGGFLPDPYAFDPLFFAIPPVSAARMDPQQRVMLETAWSALEDAGIRPRDLPRRSGVYIGASTQSFATLAARAAPPPGGKALTVETDLSDIANRISFLMDLHGPSLTVDTACSASLTAVHLALKALAAGDCEAALVGGVNLTLDPLRISQFSDKGMLTPEQLCRPFGDGPGGFVDGEGAVALVLKPLSRAQRDGDRIIALLAGSASNSGGRASAYTVPDPSAQAALVREALDDAGLSAQALTYVECHGTGTKLGDPIELEGLTRAFAPDDVAPGACRIGSLKANIGHLIGAAGIAGLAKLLVQAEQRWIAPSLNAIPANPRLDFAATPFTVAIAGQPWEPATPGAPLVGGVSSFGSGGSNAHVIVQGRGTPDPLPDHPARSLSQAVVLSARSGARLKAQAERLVAALEAMDAPDPALPDIAHTLRTGREPLAKRLGMVVDSRGELVARLRAWLAGDAKAVAQIAQQDREGADGLIDRFLAGEDVDWSAIYPAQAFRKVSLPAYPFERMALPLPGGVSARPAMPKTTGATASVVAEEAVPGSNTPPSPASDKGAPIDPLSGLLTLPRWVSEPLSEGHASAGMRAGVLPGTVLVIGSGPMEEGLRALGCAVESVAKEASAVTARLTQTKAPLPERILFVGFEGASGPDGDPRDPQVVEHATRTGPLVLRAAVAALSARGGGDWPHLTILTADALPAGGRPVLDPLAAGLHGFAKSLAKEDSALPVSCIDLCRADGLGRDGLADPDVWADLARAVLLEPADPRGDETVLRAGRRLRRRLSLLEMGPQMEPETGSGTGSGTAGEMRDGAASDRPVPLRDGGVYLIVGGAGGLGAAFSRHLAQTRGAKLVWLGRRAEDDTIRAAMAEVRAVGGEVLYYSGDASDPCVVAAACAAARGRFGALHGVVHSAIVLNDMAVARMDDAAFRKAYDIKAAGIAALAKAVADAPLDWFLVFSSGLSVLGFPGQSNYAAGCAVKDALVHWLAARSDVSYPVRTINWGYWGTTGIVANPVHERRLAALGLLNMDPAAGMAAIERILASPTPQVLAMKATDALLETLGLRPDRVEAATGPAPEILGPARATGLEADPADPTVAAAWRAGRDAFEAAAPAMVLGALDPLGLRTQLLAAGQAGQVGAEGTKGAGGPAGIGVKALRQSLGIVDRHIRLFTACLRILDRAGLVQLDPGAEDVARVTALPGLAEAASGGPELAAQLGRDHPSTAGFCALTEACLARFAETVTGKTAPTDVLFPEGSMDLVDPIYRGNPEADRCNIQTTAAVVALTKAKLAAAGPEARVTIVEIGAGTGGTTRTLLPDLAPFGDRLRYVYTDISRAFTAHGKRVFGAEYPFVDYTVLDIERDPAPQGFPPCGVDIVVATNVLHATKDMANTLGHVKALLAEGGCLIANEITMASAFTTLTFGLVDGWWLFQDVSERLPDAPLLAPDTWRRILGELGYRSVQLLPGLAIDGGLGDQNVIVGESDGLRRLPAQQNPTVSVPAPAPAAAVASAPVPVSTSLSNDAPSNGTGSPVSAGAPGGDAMGVVIAAVASALGMPEDQVEPDAAFRDYGVDSIVGVRLVREVNKALGANLAITDLFDHPSARKLAVAALTSGGSVGQATAASAPAAPATPVASATAYVVEARSSQATPPSTIPPATPSTTAATAYVGAAASQQVSTPTTGPVFDRSDLLDRVCEALADVLSVPVAAVDPDGDVSEMGLGAADAEAVGLLLGVYLGHAVPGHLFHDHRTARAVARALSPAPSAAGAVAGSTDTIPIPSVGSPMKPPRASGVGSQLGPPRASGVSVGATLEPTAPSTARIVVASSTPIPSPSVGSPIEPPRASGVAVVGMAGRFPGCPDLEAYWQAIRAGRNLVTEAPPERWDAQAWYDPEVGRLDRTHCRFGSFVEGAELFDPAVHGLSLREAAWMDPQQRIFLDVCRDALEHSGKPASAFEGGSVGVFAGVGEGDYVSLIRERGLALPPQSFWGNASSVLAARIAYLLDLKGPALAMDTACSSSLVAIHEACQSVLSGECDLALAGGVFLRFTPQFHIFASNAGMLSPTGRCAAFDASADGFVPGEGAGAVLLKPLEKALADGDPIHGVIRASGLNQDGRTNGITAPSARSQTELERAVWAKAGIAAQDLSYIEAHGTGTPLGDPVEFKALRDAVQADTALVGFLPLGSVKANLGHAAMAAGAAGLLKLLLMLREKTLPPLPHFSAANPHLPLDDAPFRFVTEAEPWIPPAGKPRIAAISSFGFSGTNAHVVLEEAPVRPGVTPPAPVYTPRAPVRCWFQDGPTAALSPDQLFAGAGPTGAGVPSTGFSAVPSTGPSAPPSAGPPAGPKTLPPALLTALICGEAAALLGLPVRSVTAETDLLALGLTTPLAARIGARLGEATGQVPETAQLMQARTVAGMVQSVVAALDQEQAA